MSWNDEEPDLHIALSSPTPVLGSLTIHDLRSSLEKENPEHCGAAVANVVYSLRRKIGDGYIETVVGSGYRFVVGIKAGAVERRTAITLYKVTTHTH